MLKINADSAKLAKALKPITALKARGKREARPADGLALLAAGSEGALTLRAVGGGMEWSETLPFVAADGILETGSVAVPAKALVKVLAGKGAPAVLEETPEGLEVTRAGRRAVIPAFPVESFPAPACFWPSEIFEAAPLALAEAIGRTGWAAEPEGAVSRSGFALQGVRFEFLEGSLRLAATDGDALSVVPAGKVRTVAGDGNVQVTVPVRAAEVLRDLAAGAPRLELALDTVRGILEAGPLRIRLLEGRFPAFDGLLPEGPFTDLALPAVPLARELAAFRKLVPGRDATVWLSDDGSGKGLRLSAGREGGAAAETVIECEGPPPAEPYGLRLDDVLAAVRTGPGDFAVFRCRGAALPMAMRWRGGDPGLVVLSGVTGRAAGIPPRREAAA